MQTAYSNEQFSQKITAAGIRPSSVRIHVLRYLEEKHNHPTADQIHQALRHRLPSLSRTSIYNALAALGDKGLVRPLKMEGNEVRYDALVHDHGHFCCRRCGEIFDFELNFPAAALPLSGCQIERRDFLVWGLCAHCNQLPLATGLE
jgi:Fe2+ or Zn2+ uptake regulation protein